MVHKRVFWLPLAVFIIGPVTFLITYLVAVSKDHVSAWFPYISETGSFPPESCIFAQFLNIMVFILIIVIYIKYRQVAEFSLLRPSKNISARTNKVAAILGVISCFGLDLVANFQESNVISVHIVGAGLCFAAGTAYFCIQVALTRKMCPEISSSTTVYLRVVISVLCVLLTIICIGAAIVSIPLFDGEDHRHWKPTDGGYGWHLTSAIAEWLLALTYLSFILSFVKEFSNIHITNPTLILTNVLQEDNTGNGHVITKDPIKTIA